MTDNNGKCPATGDRCPYAACGSLRCDDTDKTPQIERLKTLDMVLAGVRDTVDNTHDRRVALLVIKALVSEAGLKAQADRVEGPWEVAADALCEYAEKRDQAIRRAEHLADDFASRARSAEADGKRAGLNGDGDEAASWLTVADTWREAETDLREALKGDA